MNTQLIVFRLMDSFGNKKSFNIIVRADNTLSYSLYGGWQSSGMGFSISNMGMKMSLPISVKDFKNVDDLKSVISECILSGYYRICSTTVLNQFPVLPSSVVYAIFKGDDLVGFVNSKEEAASYCKANSKLGYSHQMISNLSK